MSHSPDGSTQNSARESFSPSAAPSFSIDGSGALQMGFASLPPQLDPKRQAWIDCFTGMLADGAFAGALSSSSNDHPWVEIMIHDSHTGLQPEGKHHVTVQGMNLDSTQQGKLYVLEVGGVELPRDLDRPAVLAEGVELAGKTWRMLYAPGHSCRDCVEGSQWVYRINLLQID